MAVLAVDLAVTDLRALACRAQNPRTIHRIWETASHVLCLFSASNSICFQKFRWRNGRFREQSVAQRTQIAAWFCEETKSLILNRWRRGKPSGDKDSGRVRDCVGIAVPFLGIVIPRL